VGFDLLSRFRKRSPDDPPAIESWPLYAFGKLPVYKDFISAGLTDDASREFRDWLSNGFSRHWSSRDEYRAAEIPLHAFLLRLPESRKMAVGALWGSRDQGGLRKFPFVLFTILAAGKPSATVLTALDYLPVFESRAREIRAKYDAGGSLAAVYQEIRGAKIEIPVRTPEQIRERLAAALADSSVGRLATSLFENDAATRWPALLSGLDAAARSPAFGAAAFRFPLAERPAPLHQLQLWAVRLSRASPDGVAPSGVLYRTGGEVPCGVFFFRDVRAGDILLFHPAATPTDFVEEIPTPARQRAVEQVEAATEPASTAPAGAEVPTPLEPGPPGEMILLGAAREAPAISDIPAVSGTPAVPDPPPAPAPAAPSGAAPVADAPPPAPPSAVAPPQAEPAGWDLPLASLLETN
jgi:type VI secretion system ImpM family protein